MLTKEFTINNKYGFHLRPAQIMVEKVTPFKSDIKIIKDDGSKVDAKSLLGLMSLGLKTGQEVKIAVNGDDEAETMNVIAELFKTNFGE